MDIINDRDLTVVVLAAGQGVRMKSPLPKVLHPLGGKALLAHVLDAAQTLHPSQIIVVHGANSDVIKDQFSDREITWAEQSPPKGTGDAVAKAIPFIPSHHRVLILYGDVPLISPVTLSHLLQHTPKGALGLLTATLPDPFGLGRIVRMQGKVLRIVEEKDATTQEREIKEINTGILLFDATCFARWIPTLKNNNAQGEYYLTDIIQWAVNEQIVIHTESPQGSYEIMGVNDRLQQVTLERIYQRSQAEKLLKEGVWICDPDRFDVRGTLQAVAGVNIDINVIFEGDNILRKGAHIGPHCVLIDCDIGENVSILAYSHLEGVKIHNNARVGPFARLRPGTILEEHVHIGNFVEIKNSAIGEASKIGHLSYIGDTVMGKSVNVGAGTITCNYDGKHKHQTIIEDDVHIGSDTQLVAPVHVGQGATIGAGSTVCHDVPENELTLTQRLEQRTMAWNRPQKEQDKG
jgi:bifunctional UDP-N-acetylglucosamine pyrophosphorylase/glucosamine-1-phosphate N-acetyltransferase